MQVVKSNISFESVDDLAANKIYEDKIYNMILKNKLSRITTHYTPGKDLNVFLGLDKFSLKFH